MTQEQLKAAIQAIKDQDGDAALAILEAELTGDTGEGGGTTTPPSGDALGSTAETPPEETPAAASAALSLLTRVTGTSNLAEAEARLSAVVQSATASDEERRTVDLASRRDMIAEFVRLGVETPATAWSLVDPSGKACTAEARHPVKRLMAEPLAEMRTRLEQCRAAKPELQRRTITPSITPAAGSVPDVSTLKPAELAECKKRGIDPADYVVRKHNAVRRLNA